MVSRLVLEGQSYIVNGYLLTLSALLILSGALADTYGRRLVTGIGCVGMIVFPFVCFSMLDSKNIYLVFLAIVGTRFAQVLSETEPDQPGNA